MDEVTCPRCHGGGTVLRFIDGPGNHRVEPEGTCSLCQGKGSVSAQQMAWIKAGRAHRDARVARGESLRDRATALGLEVTVLSAMEHGKADPAPLGEVQRHAHPG